MEGMGPMFFNVFWLYLCVYSE